MNNKYGQIYKITNQVDGKVYIGKTIYENVVSDRYGGSLLHTHNAHLKYAILKYGVDGFEVSNLCWANSKEELEEKEKAYIFEYDALNGDKGYNMHEGGQGGRMSDETIIKIGQKSQEMWDNSPERKIKLAESMRGENNFLVKMGGHTEDIKLKMSESRKKLLEDEEFLHKSLQACYTPEANRNRVISCSKFWIVQYDLEMKEVNRFHTLKDAHSFMLEDGIEIDSKYKSFKGKHKQSKVFGEHPYKGYYWRKIEK